MTKQNQLAILKIVLSNVLCDYDYLSPVLNIKNKSKKTTS